MSSRDKLEDLLARCGTHRMRHSGRSLYHHLRGTEFLLRTWECTEEVCLAGLFHSIYGTSAFRHSSLAVAQRGVLSDAIGLSAERLVYLFHSCDRPLALLKALQTGDVENRLDGARISLSDHELSGLIEIECANLLEQDSGAKFIAALAPALARHAVRLSPLLSASHSLPSG